MASKIINIVNIEKAMASAKESITAVTQSLLQSKGDYEYVVFKLEPNHRQRKHFHTYGDIDIFTVAEGSAYLHLAKIEEDKIVPGTEEKILVKKGDTYSVGPYTLHGLETTDDSVMVLNIAPGNHSAPAEGDKHQRSVDVFYPKQGS